MLFLLMGNYKRIAESLNQHFLSIGKKLAKVFSSTSTKHNDHTISSSSFELQPVTTEFVREQLNQLKTNKAIGLDKISAHRLAYSVTVLLLLLHLCAISLNYLLEIVRKNL